MACISDFAHLGSEACILYSDSVLCIANAVMAEAATKTGNACVTVTPFECSVPDI